MLCGFLDSFCLLIPDHFSKLDPMESGRPTGDIYGASSDDEEEIAVSEAAPREDGQVESCFEYHPF